MKTVAIIHPWMPQYRVSFFEALRDAARQAGLRVDVYFGDVPPEWSERNDSMSPPWATRLETKYIRLGRKNLTYKSLKDFSDSAPEYDLVVLEQAVRNLETYRLMLRYRKGRLAFWGHGQTYTQTATPVQESFKQWLTRRAGHFFAYTDGGAEHVRAAGFDPERITVVKNSTDTKALSADLANVSSQQINSTRQSFAAKKILLFIGGMDSSKRLGFLLDSFERMDPRALGIHLVAVGAGPEAYRFRDAAKRGLPVSALGPLFGHEKAAVMAASDAVLMPGRVGLVAVDCLTAGLPVVTTNWPLHAPEFEYLSPGRNCVVVDDDPSAFADEVVALLADEDRLVGMRAAALQDAEEFSVGEMASRFLTGIRSSLNNAERSYRNAK